MANKMLIDATHPEETRVVVVRGNRVEEFDFESANRRQLRGNIYLAKVTRVEPSLQAAFIEYGGNRHGFLAFGEIHPDYYQIPVADRQALLDEEERAHRDTESEYERRAGNGRSGGRGEAAHARRDDARHATVDATAEAGEAKGEAEQSPAQFSQTEAATQAADTEAATPTEAEPAAEGEHAATDVAQDTAGEAAASDDSTAPSDQAAAIADYQVGANMRSTAAEAQTHSRDNGPVSQRSPDDGSDRNSGVEEVGSDEDDAVESVGGADALEEAADRVPRFRRSYKIQEVIKRRQVMLVQVVKEERGTKGAALTTYLSLAGRYSVLMPNTARGGGISRKITSAQDRKRLKEVAQELDVPEGMGVILRTAGANRTKPEIKRDFEYLMRMWETVRDTTLKSSAPTLVYEEGSLIKRSIRDLYNKDIDEVVVAGEAGFREAKDFMRMLTPSHAKNVKLYKDSQPLLTRFGIESQLDAMFSPVVQLRSGGYLVINQTEALVSIDVNSGRATREHHIEDTALKTNMEAAEEIARQLRLRDLAGLIVIDFIDMDEKRNNRSVERKMKECLKNDRARIQVGRISHFGLLEMSRQRIRSSVLENTTEKCPSCGGLGHVRSVSSVTLQMLRSIEEMLLKGATHNLIARTRAEIALYVLNQKRTHLHELEQRFQIGLRIEADATVSGEQPFLIERGEQVHTPEAARAIADQSKAMLAHVAPDADDLDEDEEAVDDGIEPDDAEADIDTETKATIADAESDDDNDADEGAEESEAGGRKRRRRRRKRRGGEPGDQPVASARAPRGTPAGETRADKADDAEADARTAGDEILQGDDAAGERGDRPRRRRGRRGGRRGRRDESDARSNGTSEAAPPADQGADGWQDWAQGGQADAVVPPRATDAGNGEALTPPAASRPDEAPVRQPDPPAIPATIASEAVTPKRRSTVREPAPFVSASAASSATPPPPVITSVVSELPPAPATPETSEQRASSQPRRTGWWARKLLGGD
jgi:ribonuclease E